MLKISIYYTIEYIPSTSSFSHIGSTKPYNIVLKFSLKDFIVKSTFFHPSAFDSSKT